MLLGVLAVALAVLVIDFFVTGVTSGSMWRYYDMVIDVAATFGVAIGAKRLLTRRATKGRWECLPSRATADQVAACRMSRTCFQSAARC